MSNPGTEDNAPGVVTALDTVGIADTGDTRINPAKDVDFMLEISRGNVSGMTHINKFGRNTAVASGGTEEIWDGSAAYVFPGTALMTKLSQTADQEAMRGATIEVQGLDASWDLVTQAKALDASLTTTAVTLDTPLIRAFRVKVLANVVGDSPIRLHNDAENQDYAIVGIGNNQTLMAIYTIPNGKTGFMTNYYAQVNKGGGVPTTMNISMWATDNENSYAKQLKHFLGISADLDTDGYWQHFFKPYVRFTEKTDVYLTATTAGAAVDVSGGFDIILVDN